MLNAIYLKSVTRKYVILAHFLDAFYKVFALFIKLPLGRYNFIDKEKEENGFLPSSKDFCESRWIGKQKRN